MKKVFSGKILEVLPQTNGIIFSYSKNMTEEKLVVSYKMISFDNGYFTDIAKTVYLLAKFGNNYKAVSSFFDNYIAEKSIVLPNNKVFLLGTDGSAQLLDTEAVPIWTGELKYRGTPASDLALHKNTLWVCYAECNALVRYHLSTMREELRIGGGKSPFDRPKSIFVEGDRAMIGNTGSHKLIEIDLNTYGVSEYADFEEPVYQYVKVGENRFAVLESGLYLL